jgi:hypothetical protein
MLFGRHCYGHQSLLIYRFIESFRRKSNVILYNVKDDLIRKWNRSRPPICDLKVFIYRSNQRMYDLECFQWTSQFVNRLALTTDAIQYEYRFRNIAPDIHYVLVCSYSLKYQCVHEGQGWKVRPCYAIKKKLWQRVNKIFMKYIILFYFFFEKQS